ncbi:MAG TPA: hypothetical protein VGP76_03400 [Planctomycetaceae bacterium]|jgi:LmbE family N-acetylglucosaminyl deacetylase|nr:hypothetical protein [Planctomycetaceae bacterium]
MTRDDIKRISKRQFRRLHRPLSEDMTQLAEQRRDEIQEAVNVRGIEDGHLWCEVDSRDGMAVCTNRGTRHQEGEAWRRATEVERHSLVITISVPDVSIDFRSPAYLNLAADRFRETADKLLDAALRLDAAAIRLAVRT